MSIIKVVLLIQHFQKKTLKYINLDIFVDSPELSIKLELNIIPGLYLQFVTRETVKKRDKFLDSEKSIPF